MKLKENSGLLMKNFYNPILALSVLAILLSSCGSRETGELVGSLDRPSWRGVQPYGMVYVPPGTAHVGNSDQDISGTFIQRPKRITTNGFFMDDTEITNNEYRQFLDWVRDSIIHDLMGDFTEGGGIDWEMDIDYEDPTIAEELFLSDRFAGRKQVNTQLFEYTYKTADWQAAARARPNGTEGEGMNPYIDEHSVNIYPDTLVWVRDFAYSYNEPMARSYFSHPAYDNYPIVGIDWHMANAFSYWRTSLWNQYNDQLIEEFRLPTEYEFEYAARGGKEHAPYPWGGPYVRNSKGCLLANFKPGRGNYPDDGGAYTVPVDAYYPNDYGLYNMAGNVAEWTVTAYMENANSFVHDMNPDIRYDAKEDDPRDYKRKVIRGGSWKDISFYLQCGTRTFEYQDTTKSYVGFRNVLSFTGRSINDF